MANENNLIPQNARTKEEQREIARKGGIASGEARRRKKTLKESLVLLLEEGDIQKDISVALIKKALKGDVKAFVTIRDTIGEKEADKLELQNSTVNITLEE